MSYAVNRAWSDRFIPAIKRIVGFYLLVPAPLDVDRQEATDLVVMRGRSMMIAARVRRPGYVDKYPNDFTIRSEIDNGAKTELSKMTDGFGDWMFYGHAAKDGGEGIDRWMIVDLRAWRAQLIRNRGGIRMSKMSNGDGTHFVAFDVTSFDDDPPILVASSFGNKEPGVCQTE